MSFGIPFHGHQGDDRWLKADRALAQFQLSIEIVHSAFSPALNHALGRSSLAALNTPGTDIHSDTFEALSMRLVPEGWIQDRRLHQLIPPSREFRLALKTATGISSESPRFALRSNSNAVAAIRSQRNRQIGLFPIAEDHGSEDGSLLVVYLLHERSGSSLKLALGIPENVLPGGTVNSWQDLVIIPTLTKSKPVIDFGDEDDGEGDGPLIIPK